MAKNNCEDCFYRRRVGETFCCHYIFMKVPRKVMRRRKKKG